MKKIYNFFANLSLTQQLTMLMITLISFFSVFFFVYVNDAVNTAVTQQLYKSLDDAQSTLASVHPDLDSYNKASGIETYPVEIVGRNMYFYKRSDMMYLTDKETEQIKNDILYMMDHRQDKLHGLVKEIEEELDSYYSILKVSDNIYWVSKTHSSSMNALKDVLVNSLMRLTAVVVLIIFLILMVWAVTIIHPLNQIRNYIMRVKNGDDAKLIVYRNDEIGALANALVDMQAELKKQEKTKEDMIHNISHDLKTPIATIKSYGESIKDGIYPYGTMEKSVDVIIENAERLEKKVHSLLYMNRVEYLISQENGEKSINMKKVVQFVIQNIQLIKPEIEIDMVLDEVIFDGSEEPWRIVVENILENALRYAKSKITIRLNETNGLSIHNDGPLMEEDRIETLFKPYEKGAGGNFGLGLSIVSKVVHAYGYQIRGENARDGVVFKIYRKNNKLTKENENLV